MKISRPPPRRGGGFTPPCFRSIYNLLAPCWNCNGRHPVIHTAAETKHKERVAPACFRSAAFAFLLGRTADPKEHRSGATLLCPLSLLIAGFPVTRHLSLVTSSSRLAIPRVIPVPPLLHFFRRQGRGFAEQQRQVNGFGNVFEHHRRFQCRARRGPPGKRAVIPIRIAGALFRYFTIAWPIWSARLST